MIPIRLRVDVRKPITGSDGLDAARFIDAGRPGITASFDDSGVGIEETASEEVLAKEPPNVLSGSDLKRLLQFRCPQLERGPCVSKRSESGFEIERRAKLAFDHGCHHFVGR